MTADSPTPDELLGDELSVGEDYVAPEDRAAEWSRMAAELSASGYSEAEVAQALAVDEETVERLLGGQQR
ncbi:hypothetical protein [Streptomyces sp. NPDC006134]|uniref:hypothetical protein n=1 Tax=Streptomyces sp. NPDC006134 TaxID=3154467 RepID=UPI0033F5A550